MVNGLLPCWEAHRLSVLSPQRGEPQGQTLACDHRPIHAFRASQGNTQDSFGPEHGGQWDYRRIGPITVISAPPRGAIDDQYS